MPVAKGPDAKSSVIVGLVGVAIAVAIAVLVLWASGSSDDVIPKLGDEVFDAGVIGRISDEIGRNGPLFYPDPTERGRDIWLTHLGTDPEVEWHAFEALVPGAADGCLAEWNRDISRFFNQCDPNETFPPDGRGLTELSVEIEEGHVIVDVAGIRDQADDADAS